LNPNITIFLPVTTHAMSKKKWTRNRKKAASRKKTTKLHNNKIETSVIKIYSHNIHGIFESRKDKSGHRIRGKHSYKFAVHKMRVEGIDAYLLQETWDETSWGPIEIDGYTVFHHNNNVKTSRTGVAIIISL
jgi:hypothetical protein